MAGLRLMGPGCWWRGVAGNGAFRPHLLFIVNFLPRNHPKMQTDCRKIKQKINWPQVTEDAGVRRAQLIGARVLIY